MSTTYAKSQGPVFLDAKGNYQRMLIDNAGVVSYELTDVQPGDDIYSYAVPPASTINGVVTPFTPPPTID